MDSEEEFGPMEMDICECGHLFEDHDVLDRCTMEFCECMSFVEADFQYMDDEITEP